MNFMKRLFMRKVTTMSISALERREFSFVHTMFAQLLTRSQKLEARDAHIIPFDAIAMMDR